MDPQDQGPGSGRPERGRVAPRLRIVGAARRERDAGNCRYPPGAGNWLLLAVPYIAPEYVDPPADLAALSGRPGRARGGEDGYSGPAVVSADLALHLDLVDHLFCEADREIFFLGDFDSRLGTHCRSTSDGATYYGRMRDARSVIVLTSLEANAALPYGGVWSTESPDAANVRMRIGGSVKLGKWGNTWRKVAGGMSAGIPQMLGGYFP